jgi:hypothetical protein
MRKAGSGSALKSKFRSFTGLKLVKEGRGGVEDHKMKPRRVCKPVVADSNHFDEEELK